MNLSWVRPEWRDAEDEFDRERVRDLEIYCEERGPHWTRVLEIVSRYDPEHLLEMGCPPGEYITEVNTIYPRLADAATVDDVRHIIQEEWLRWFDHDLDARGATQFGPGWMATVPATSLDSMAQEIWDAWQSSS